MSPRLVTTMKRSLQIIRTSTLIILFSSTTYFAGAAIITAIATGDWSATAWPNTGRAGNITSSVASPTITGTGATLFLTQVSVGNIIKTAGNVVIGTVLTVNSNASITLTANALSTNVGIAYNVQGIGPADAALIPGGITVTVDNATATCISLGTAGSGVGASTLAFNAGSHLTVNGTVTLGIAGHAGNIDMTNGGFLTCQKFTVTNGGVWTPGAGTVEFTLNNTIPATLFTSFNNLIINLGTTTTSAPLTINGDLSIGSGSANFTAAGFPLTVTGTTTVGAGTLGNLTISSATGAKTFTGLVTMNTGGVWNNTANAPITFQGGILNSGTFNAGTGIQTFNTNAQTLTGTFNIPSVLVTGITVTNNSTLSISTALNGTGQLSQANFAILNIAFAGTPAIAVIDASGFDNTVDYDFAGDQTVFPINYFNLTFSGDGVKTLQTGTTSILGDFVITSLIGGTPSTTAVIGLTVAGFVFIDAGTTFNSGAFSHSVGEDVINSGTFNGVAGMTVFVAGNVNNSGVFNANADTINFNGTGQQTITNTGTGSFDNLIVNNSGVGIQLENDISASISLTMTQGNIDLNGFNMGLGVSVAQIGTLVRTSGTIINGGTFTRAFNSSTIADGSISGLFPLGTLTDYRPIAVSAPTVGPAVGGTITAVYTDATGTTPVSIVDGPDTIKVIDNFFWTLTPGNGLTGGIYDLDASGTGFGGITNINDLRLSLNNAVVGTAGVNGGTTIDPQVNRINLANADLSNSFFIGSVDTITSPLPITLVYFTANPFNTEVKLAWETAAEFNNDHFTILRSTNTVNWESIDVVPGSGNTSVTTDYTAYDEKPYSGISYYRLQQTDRDGRQSYSSIVSVNMGLGTSIIIYPNPATDYLFITNIISSKFEVSLVNSSGQQMNIPTTINSDNIRLNVGGIPAGTYFLNMIQDGTNITRTVIKK
jgi:hypothetical protein